MLGLSPIYPLVICDIAIEHGQRKFVDVPTKNGDFPISFLYVYQRLNPMKSHSIPLKMLMFPHEFFVCLPGRARLGFPMKPRLDDLAPVGSSDEAPTDQGVGTSQLVSGRR